MYGTGMPVPYDTSTIQHSRYQYKRDTHHTYFHPSKFNQNIPYISYKNRSDGMKNEIILYRSDELPSRIEVRVEDETFG